ncbi:uncharacterized protein [Diadema setosum]|uniref:uncharacterized protein n=1 Tax=Diadema setosum TaxID=31175 RepID=UPI003B3ADEDA
MMLLLASMLLCSGLSSVDAITCNTCLEMTSTSPTLQALLSGGADALGVTDLPVTLSCQSPTTMPCPDTCVAQQFIFPLSSDTYGDGTVTLTQLNCSDPRTDGLPFGPDNCLSPDIFAIIAGPAAQSIEDTFSPDVTVTDITGSYCVCDTDNCNVVPASAVSNPTMPTTETPAMGNSAEPEAGYGADKHTTMEITTAGAEHILASVTLLIGSLLGAIVFRAM